MGNNYYVDPQGEINSTPLGNDPINPKSGLEVGKSFQIDAEKLKSYRALAREDMMGRVYNDNTLIPKSIFRVLDDDYHPEFDPEYNAKLLSREQSNGGKFLSALNQAVIGEIGGGTIEGLGYLLDLPMMFDLAEGTEQEFGNAITDFGKSIGKWAEEATPVFTDPTAPKFNPTSFEWWMKHAPSVASTISLVLPSMGGMAALKAMGNLVGATKALGNMGKYSKLFSTSVGQAVMSRHMESLMESQGVYDQGLNEAKEALYKKYAPQIDQEINSLPIFTPVDPEIGPKPGQYTKEQYDADLNAISNKWEDVIRQEASKVAAVGAANTYSKNWVLLLQDIPEYMLLNRFLNKGAKTIAKDATEKSAEVAKFLGMNMPAFYASKTLKHVSNMAGESLEEGYQFLTNEQSSEMIRSLADPDADTSLTKQLKDNYDNGEFWTNMWFGAIGAGVMQASMAGLNAKALSDAGKARVKQLTEFSTLMNKLHSDYVAAEEAGDIEEMEAAKKGFVSAVGIKAEQMGNKEHLMNFIDALASDDQNVLSSYEVDKTSREFFKGKTDIAEGLKNDINGLSKRYNDALAQYKAKGVPEKNLPSVAASIAHSNHMLEYLNERLGMEQGKLNDMQIKGYNVATEEGEQLSDQGKQAFQVAYQKRDIQRRIKEVEKQLAKKDITPADKNKYERRKKNLESKLVLADEVIKDLKEDKTLTAEQRKIDAKLTGDLTSETPNGVIPRGKNPEHPDEKGVLDFIDVQKSVNSYEQSIDYFKGNLESTRAYADKLIAGPKPAAKPAATPAPEELTALDVNDYVNYTTTDGVKGRGIVDSIEYATKDKAGNDVEPSAENADNIITAQPVNEQGEKVGPLLHLSGASVVKDHKESQSAVDPALAEDDTDDLDDMLPKEGQDPGDNLKDQNRRRTAKPEKRGLIEFLSYTEYEDEKAQKGKLKKLIVRNQELDDFLSDPENQKHLPDAVAKYNLNLNNQNFKDRLAQLRKDKMIPLALADAIDEHIKNGKALTESEKKQFTQIVDLFGNVAIEVELTINGKKFKKGLFMHTLDKTKKAMSRQTEEEKKNFEASYNIYAQLRKTLVTNLLNGDKVYTVGFSTNRGNPTNIDKTNNPSARKRDVAKTLGVESYKDIELFVLKSSTKSAFNQPGGDKGSYNKPQLYKDSSSVEEISFDFSSVGSVFVKTNKTVNGQPFAIKLNKSYVSEDHAYVLFNAFSTLAKSELETDKEGKYTGKLRTARKGGKIGRYIMPINPHEKDPKNNSVAWNIAAGELIDLLVVQGEELTDPDSERYKYAKDLGKISEQHMKALKNKRLFLQRGYDANGNVDGIYLCFGLTGPYGIGTASKGVLKTVDYNRINLTSKRASKSEAAAYFQQVKLFTDWIQNNKTYAVHLEHKGLHQKLNGSFMRGRSFRIGKKGLNVSPVDLVTKKYTYQTKTEIVREPGETYVEFLLKNGLVTTDLEAKNGNLFTTPFLHLGFNNDYKSNFGLRLGEGPVETEKAPVAAKVEEVETKKGKAEKVDVEKAATEKKPKGKSKKSVRSILEDDIHMREKPSDKTVWEVQDLEKELAWMRKTLNLGEDELQVEKSLAKLMLNGRQAWATFSSSAITIFEGAERGSLYHEAYHKVSLAYFTKEEREAIYRSARQLYKMSKEEFTDDQVEERLAEEFRGYVLTKQEAPQPKFIKRIFQELYNLIKALFFRAGVRITPTEVEKVFNQIYSGKYRFAKTINRNIAPRMRVVLGENFESINTYKDVTMVTKYLARRLKEVNKVDSLNRISRLDYDKLIDDINKRIKKLEEALVDPEYTDKEKNTALKVMTLLKDVLGERDENGMYPKFGAWRMHINRFLSDMGVVRRPDAESEDSLYEEDRRYSDLADEEEGSGNRVDISSAKEDYFKPVKKNALANVKFVISTLHESDESDDSTGLIGFADGNEVWYKLLHDVIDYDDVEDMVKRIRALGESQNYYPYVELAELLDNSSENFRTQFQSTFELYKHQHLVTSFGLQGESGEVDIVFDNATHYELSRSTILRWNEELRYDRDAIQIVWEDQEKGTIRDKKVNKAFFDKILVVFKDTVYDWYVDKSNNGSLDLSEKDLDALFTRTSKVLSKLHIHVSEDVLRYYAYIVNRDRSLQNNLFTFLNKIQGLIGPELVEDKDGFTNIISNETVRMLGEAYADVNAVEESDMVVGPEGHMIWRFGKLSLVSDNKRRIKRSAEWSRKKLERIGNKHSRILRSFVPSETLSEEEAKLNREAFDILTMSSFKKKGRRDKGRDYLHLNVVEDYLFKAYSILKEDILPLPVMANRGTYYLMKGVKLVGTWDKAGDISNVLKSSTETGEVVFTDEVINMFYDYYLDEKERVDTALVVKENYKSEKKRLNIEKRKPDADIRTINKQLQALDNSLVRNYHYIGDFNLEGGNAYHFIHFKGFDKLKTPEEIRAKINEVLNSRLLADIQFAHKEGIVQYEKDRESGKIAIVSKKFNKQFVGLHDSMTQPDNFALLSVLAKVMVNTQMGVLESERLFLADPALFKRNKVKDKNNFDTYNDEYKRWFGVGSTGTRLRVKMPGRSTTYNVSVIKTQKFASMYYEPMLEKHIEWYTKLLTDRLSAEDKKNPDLVNRAAKDAEQLAEEALAQGPLSYKNVDPTDGTAFISPEMFKEIHERLGLWDDKRMQEAFDLLNSEEDLTPEEILRATNIVFNPIKTMYIGHHDFNGIDLLIYNKMAMFTLFRQHVKGTHLEEVLDRMELKGRYSRNNILKEVGEKLEKIHVYNFDTAVKTGILNATPLFVDGGKRHELTDLSNSLVFKQDFDNLKHQQVVEPHSSAKQTFGTAGFKIGSADIVKDQNYGEEGTGEELLKKLHRARAVLSDFGLHKVDARFGISNGKISNKMLIELLKRDADAANKSFDFIKALKTDVNGDKYLEIDSFNDRKWIYSRIKTIVDETTVELETPGNQLVQMTDYGMNPTADYTKELKFIRYNEEGTAINEIEARVSIRLFKTFFPKGHNITKKEAEKLLNTNPLLFGYRVPTQGQNSIFKIRIVDFLPEQAGDIIQLPLEFTTVTGSDFDIDKLFVAMHSYEYTKDEDGDILLSKVKFSTSDDEAADRYKNKMLELFNIYKNSIESFRNVLDRDKYGKLEGIVSKYFGKFSEVVQLRDEYQANVDSYKEEEANLIAMVKSINKSIESTKDKLFKIKLENDLRNAITQLENVQGKLNSIPSHLYYREIVDSLDWVALEEVLVDSGKLPKFDDFKNLPIEEQNTREGLQNRLLDLLFVVLSDPKHFVNMTTPLGAMTNILEDKAEEYEEIYNAESQESAPALYTTTPSFQSATKQKFSSSTFGIAPYALSNNHHSLTQMANIAIMTDLELGFNKKGEIDLARIVGEDNRYISWWISALIDAHVDGVNKPYITSLNINESTHDILNLLIRSGMGEVSFDFLNQPIMREYSYAYFKTSKNFGEGANKISTIEDTDALTYVWKLWTQIAIEKGLFTEAELQEGNFRRHKLIPLAKLFSKKQLKADAIESKKDVKSKEYYIRQLSILTHLLELKEESENLRSFVLASRVDTGKYGSNPVEIVSFLNNIKKVMKLYVVRDNQQIPKFRNIDKVLTYNPEYKYQEGDTFLPTLIKNGMFKIYEILRYDSIYATPGFGAMLTDLVDATKSGDYSRQSLLNTMSEEIVSYFIGKFMSDPVNGLGVTYNDVWDILFTKDNSFFELISNLKTGTHPSSSKVKDNPFLNNLIVDFSEDIIEGKDNKPVPYTFLRTPFRAKNNDLTRDEEIDGFKDLLNSEDSVLAKLALDAYLYSYYTSAFRQRISSFSHAFPLEMNRELKYKGRIISFNKFMKDLVAKLNTPEGYLEYITEAKREIFGNLWDTRDVPFEVDIKMTTTYQNKNGELIGARINLTKENIRSMRLGYNANREAVYVPYIKIGDSFLEYFGYDRQTGAPFYAVAPKKGFGSNGHGTKGLFFYEYGIRSSKGDNKSLLLSNQQTYDWASTEESAEKIMKHVTSKGEADYFVSVPLKAQLVVEKDSPRSDGFEIVNEADILRDQQAIDEEANKQQMQRNVLNRQIYSTREYENDEAANRQNSDLKASKNNLTTYDNPIFIDVDGSNNPTNGLGAGAYAEFMGKKYFMRRTNDDVIKFLNAALKMKGYPEATKITNPEAELYALLVVLDSFKNTSEHIYINQDYSTLMYFVDTPGVAVNPSEVNKTRLDFIQFTPDPKKPNMVVLIDMLQKRIDQIRSNGGSVRIKYIPTKSTTANRIVDKVAKGEHKVSEKRNDFADEKWGNSMLPIANTTNNDSKEADENNTKCK